MVLLGLIELFHYTWLLLSRANLVIVLHIHVRYCSNSSNNFWMENLKIFCLNDINCTFNNYVIARSICKFKYCTTVSIISSISSCNNLTIVFEVKIYCPRSLTSCYKGGCFIEIHLKLRGPYGRILCVYDGNIE